MCSSSLNLKLPSKEVLIRDLQGMYISFYVLYTCLGLWCGGWFLISINMLYSTFKLVNTCVTNASMVLPV